MAHKYKNSSVELAEGDYVECPNGHVNWRGEWTLIGMDYLHIRCPECEATLTRDAQSKDE